MSATESPLATDSAADAVQITDLEAIVSDSPLERLIASSPAPLRKAIAVLRFESRRTKTAARRAIWLLLVLFPVGIMFIFRLYADEQFREEGWGVVLYVLLQVVCLLGLLLWVSPLLQSELESRTWAYLAVRPGGKSAVIFGKYLNGVFWTASAGLIGLSLAMFVALPKLVLVIVDPLRLYLTLSLLVVCSTLSYASLYTLLGVIFPRRSMIICLVYTLVIEVLISAVPAMVNQLTLQHRLINVLIKSMEWEFPPEFRSQLSSSPIWLNLAALLGFTAFNLTLGTIILRRREYVTSEQN